MKPGYFLTGYFSVHSSNASSETGCGKIDPNSGIYLVEAMRYAIDEINRNESLLFGAKIDYQIVDTCNNLKRIQKDLRSRLVPNYYNLGFIGPASSEAALLAAPILTSFGVPVISYHATSIDLEDRVLHANFYRTIPSDFYQALAITDLLNHFNWTYVTTVYSHGNYGQRGMETLIPMMIRRGICVQTSNLIQRYPFDSDFDAVVTKLLANPNVNVVVLFTNGEDTIRLLKSIKRAGKRAGNLTLVSSTAWSPDHSFTTDLETAAKGALVLNYANMSDPNFEKYFMSLSLRNNSYKWFREFWEDTFDCNAGIKNSSKVKCTGKERLQDSNLDFKHSISKSVISAVHIYACALRHKIFMKYCSEFSGSNLTTCVKKNHYPVFYYPRFDLYRLFLTLKTGCPEFPLASDFQADGSIARDFEILNFDGGSYTKVGSWKYINANESNINVLDDNIMWKGAAGNKIPISSCTLPCSVGEISSKDVFRPECCIICIPCPTDNIVINNTCKKCGWAQNPNNYRTKCIDIPFRHFGIEKNLGKIIIAFSSVGIILVVAMLCFSASKTVPSDIGLIKDSMGIVVLFGCLLKIVSSLLALAKASIFVCVFQDLMFSLASATCYTPLMLFGYYTRKLLISARRNSIPVVRKSMKSKAALCLGLIGIQVLMSAVWVIARPPKIHYQFTLSRSSIHVMCRSGVSGFLVSEVPGQIIMVVAGVFAYQNRKHLAARKLSLAIFATISAVCCLWAVFIPLLFWSHAKGIVTETALKAIFADILALLTLFGIYGPILKMSRSREVEPRTD